MDLLIVGAGPMAQAHALAAAHMGASVTAVCRSPAAAAAFSARTGLACRSGGIAACFAAGPAPSHAIVAVPVEMLASVSRLLIESGVRRLLVEKPAGIDIAEIRGLADLAARTAASVHVGYNRRFYPSVVRARELLAEAGGAATSLRFDFTERSDLIAAGKHDPAVRRTWVLANSSHVIDLAFHLAGEPRTLSAHVSGGLSWHPAGSRFAGIGETATGAPFSYHADWDAPGRWSIDIRTPRRRLLFEPLEELRCQVPGSLTVEIEHVPAEPERLKPGVLGQLRAFLEATPGAPLVTIGEHVRRCETIYMPIAGGGEFPART